MLTNFDCTSQKMVHSIASARAHGKKLNPRVLRQLLKMTHGKRSIIDPDLLYPKNRRGPANHLYRQRGWRRIIRDKKFLKSVRYAARNPVPHMTSPHSARKSHHVENVHEKGHAERTYLGTTLSAENACYRTENLQNHLEPGVDGRLELAKTREKIAVDYAKKKKQRDKNGEGIEARVIQRTKDNTVMWVLPAAALVGLALLSR